MTKEQLVQDIQQMERVYNEYRGQLEQLVKAVEQQAGGIQYARMLLARMEKEGEEALAVNQNHKEEILP